MLRSTRQMLQQKQIWLLRGCASQNHNWKKLKIWGNQKKKNMPCKTITEKAPRNKKLRKKKNINTVRVVKEYIDPVYK